MKLSVKDRLNVGILFPEKGNILEQIMVKDINKKVSLTDLEIEEYGVKTEGALIKWDASKAKDKEIDFTGAEIDFLREQVKILDKNKQITQEILGLCLIFRSEKL